MDGRGEARRVSGVSPATRRVFVARAVVAGCRRVRERQRGLCLYGREAPDWASLASFSLVAWMARCTLRELARTGAGSVGARHANRWSRRHGTVEFGRTEDGTVNNVTSGPAGQDALPEREAEDVHGRATLRSEHDLRGQVTRTSTLKWIPPHREKEGNTQYSTVVDWHKRQAG